jgi:flagellar export protein FliJ
MVKPALPTLIKLAQKAVEDIQTGLATNRSAQAETQGLIAHWKQEAATAFASSLSEADVKTMQAATAFQARAQREERALEDTLKSLQVAEEDLLGALQTAFAKQKRYEILAEAQALKAKTDANRKAQAALDDLRRKG